MKLDMLFSADFSDARYEEVTLCPIFALKQVTRSMIFVLKQVTRSHISRSSGRSQTWRGQASRDETVEPELTTESNWEKVVFSC